MVVDPRSGHGYKPSHSPPPVCLTSPRSPETPQRGGDVPGSGSRDGQTSREGKVNQNSSPVSPTEMGYSRLGRVIDRQGSKRVVGEGEGYPRSPDRILGTGVDMITGTETISLSCVGEV